MARIGVKLVTALSLFALTSCAIPYQDQGPVGRFLTNGGIDELRLNDTSYQITVQGNGATSPQRVRDFVLLRASELAIRAGFPYFQINGSSNASRTSIEAVSNAYGTSVQTVFRPGLAVVVSLTTTPGIDAAMMNRQLAPKYGVALTAGASTSANDALIEEASTALHRCGIPGDEDFTATKTLDQVHRQYGCARTWLAQSRLARMPAEFSIIETILNAQEGRWEKVIEHKFTPAEAKADQSASFAKMAAGR
jgi:hypothetical protein